jgi:hypothetical protein
MRYNRKLTAALFLTAVITVSLATAPGAHATPISYQFSTGASFRLPDSVLETISGGFVFNPLTEQITSLNVSISGADLTENYLSTISGFFSNQATFDAYASD